MAKKQENLLKQIAFGDITFEKLFQEIYLEHDSTNNSLDELLEHGVNCINPDVPQITMQLLPNLNSLLVSKIKNQESKTKLISSIHKIVTNNSLDEESSDVTDLKKMIQRSIEKKGQIIATA
jgi:hypothetical protein